MLCLAGSYPDEHSDFVTLTNQRASVNCVNNSTFNTVLDIFHLFRFFMYWNDWFIPSIKTTLTPVYCCLLCITDCVGALVGTVLFLMQTKSKSFWISVERASALVCDGWGLKQSQWKQPENNLFRLEKGSYFSKFCLLLFAVSIPLFAASPLLFYTSYQILPVLLQKNLNSISFIKDCLTIEKVKGKGQEIIKLLH